MPSIPDLIAPIAKTVLHWMSKRSLPQTQGTINLPAISASAEIFRDQWGIPHIYAENQLDLFFAQGFVHAQDRLWQMELNRRTGQGRLSELFGEVALDTDRTIRTFGFNRLGVHDLEMMETEERDVVAAYAAGVNAYLEHAGKKLPVEFSLLRHRPHPWRPEDTTTFMRVMIWQLSHGWHHEIVRARLIQAVGEERASELAIHYPTENPVVLPNGIKFGSTTSRVDPFLQQDMGSNAWAVSGMRSDTGKPYLCNDMHLQINLPGLWYEAHLEAGNFRVTGVTLPGIPGVMVGHNARIAWGMTLAFTDCEDLFIEEFDPASPYRYKVMGGWKEAEIIEEVIHTKGKPDPFIEKVIITRHGPVISSAIGYTQEALAVNSMALRPSSAFKGWLSLNKAQDWAEFVEAMRLIDAPQLNVAYADVDDNIGYWVTGRVPIRAGGDGSIPVPGWNDAYEWVSEVPFEAMPHSFNPENGYIVHCNNRIVPDDYPYYLGNLWMNGYRARRIVQVLESIDRLSVSDFKRLHSDFTCLPGLEFVSRLTYLQSDDPDVRMALERLRTWDGKLVPDSIAGALYEVTRYTLVRNLLESSLGADLTFEWMGEGFHPVLYATNEFFGHDTVSLFRLLDQPNSLWIKQSGGLEKLLSRSLKQAVDWLRGQLGSNPDEWQWGHIHHVIFAHALSLQKPLDKVFNRGPFPIGGDTDTPCQTAMQPRTPYDNKAWAPSVRLINDLGDLSRSVAIFPPGQSGQLSSPHYDDLIEPWLSGEYHPMLWEREAVESAAVAKLILEKSTD